MQELNKGGTPRHKQKKIGNLSFGMRLSRPAVTRRGQRQPLGELREQHTQKEQGNVGWDLWVEVDGSSA
jgi:hypothetical protein